MDTASFLRQAHDTSAERRNFTSASWEKYRSSMGVPWARLVKPEPQTSCVPAVYGVMTEIGL